MELAEKRGKIIHTLRERRRVEAAIHHLARLSGPTEAKREAGRIAGMGAQVIPALTGLLDTANPRLLSALGLVVTHLDREKATRALRQVATGPLGPDRARLAALLILERFLGQELDGALYQGLEAPETAVAQSLAEMAEYAVADRGILYEYVLATEQQPDDVSQLIVDFTCDLGSARAALPLWALAQSQRQDVAELALHRLGSLRSPVSAAVLQALLVTLPPARRVLAERSLRKLQFSGVDVPALSPPHPAWRALISPIDGQGSQSIWFILDPQQDAPTRVLSLLVGDLVGIQEVGYDRDGELIQHLPPRGRLGTVHQVAFPDAATTLPLLEAEFDLGRRLVQQALAVSHARDRASPLGYAVLSDALWKWSGPRKAGHPALERPSAGEAAALRPRTGDLLRHSAFATWFVQSEAVLKTAARLGWGALFHGRPGLSPAVAELVGGHFSPQATARYCHRLEGMAEWLWLAGDEGTATLALAAAVTLGDGPPESHPLAGRMVQAGLAVALQSLAVDAHRLR